MPNPSSRRVLANLRGYSHDRTMGQLRAASRRELAGDHDGATREFARIVERLRRLSEDRPAFATAL